MVFLFWVIIVVWVIFGFVGTRVPTLAPYGWWPGLILFIILGFKLFGFPH
ncbi:MAG: hypothetical protein ABR949_10080 [Candidatus Aquilonibacter sp.]|jgi:hypothetical protein